MRSVTSCCNSTLLRRNLTQFWPLWAGYTFIWLLILPLSVFNQFSAHYADHSLLAMREHVLLAGLHASVFMTAIFGAFFAMATCSYLCAGRSTNFYHSLPIRRQSLFLTNYLSGLSFFVLPHVVVLLITLAAQGAVGLVELPSLLIWFYVATGTGIFFYSFAVLVAQFTGQLLAIPVLYGIFNFLVIGMEALLRELRGQFLFGWCNSGNDWHTDVLSPLFYFYEQIGTESTHADVEPWPLIAVDFVGGSTVLIYTLVGLVLAAAALRLYLSRRSEAAGDTIAYSWAKPIFRYGVGVCSGIAMGQGLYVLVNFSRPQSLLRLILCIIFTGFVGYATAEMLLRKTVKLSRRSLRGGVLLCLGLAVATGLLSMDITGYEKRIPSASQVESVSLRGARTYSEDIATPAAIDAVQALHAAVIADQHRQEQLERETYQTPAPYSLGIKSAVYPQHTVAEAVTHAESTINISIDYTLKDGTRLERRYPLTIYADELSRPGSVAYALHAACNQKDIYWSSALGEERIGWLSDGTGTLLGGQLYRWNEENIYGREEVLTQTQVELVVAALCRDVSANRHPLVDLFVDESKSWGAELTFSMSFPNERGEDSIDKFGVQIYEEMTETMRALEQLDLLSDKA